ncbi:hypothetical protein [Streptomyces triticiradicis]|uniref:Recombinase family protein n=1 Tax=Streptomyces triticiradicis TaxID=2651189 RepID=A0A7J5DM62_9ACTN|nr:hypothetical protein [Streptomyces triticiradicis]KAB1989789.1 hypothetical protein F8144_05435 [Streptomyces triticiradicis]
MTRSSGSPAFASRLEDTRLEIVRRRFQSEIVAAARDTGRTVRVTPYVLAEPGDERRADLELIDAYVRSLGWQLAATSFADVGQAPVIGQRPGFTQACMYAAQGFAHGIVAISRAAITTDNDTYALVLEQLHHRSVFLSYLPGETGPEPT